VDKKNQNKSTREAHVSKFNHSNMADATQRGNRTTGREVTLTGIYENYLKEGYPQHQPMEKCETNQKFTASAGEEELPIRTGSEAG
jgi:hypothetical protein